MHSQNSGSIHQDLPDDQELPKIDITATKACSSKQKNLLIDNEAYAKEILKQTSYYSLIGGRVKYGETTIEALIREIQEEIGIKVNKKETKLINVSENFFKYNGKEFHELLFIYKIKNKQVNQISEIKTLDKTSVVNTVSYTHQKLPTIA